jgi:tRNA(Ile)-lysidine synthase
MIAFDLDPTNITFPIAVAVSGGPDSMALLLLAQQWAQRHKGSVVALTVDHGLRPNSAQESEQVHAWATKRGIHHETLKWEGPKPSSHIQEKARNARYHLLLSWCKDNQVSTLLLGHHQQDQEETFWLRLTGGSGLEGLTGMKESSRREGVTLLRPLLGVCKESLKQILKAEGQDWIEDPSNHHPHFFRGKLREVLQNEGLSTSRVIKTMTKLQEDACFIHDQLKEALKEILCCHPGGYLSLQKEAFLNLHPALSKRILSLCVQWFSSSSYSLRSHHIQGIQEKLKHGLPFTAGTIYWFHQQERIYLSRELSCVQSPLKVADVKTPILWDNRFWIDPQINLCVPPDTFVSLLGEGQKSFIESSEIPRRLWPSLPALWIQEKVVAVPHLGYSCLKSQKDLKKFISTNPFIHDSLRLII